MKLYKCSVCNYVEEAEEIEKDCLKCGAPVSAFNELSEEQTEKVYNSERTNDILMQINSLTMQMVELCYEGVEIDLDPACVKAFTYTNDKAWEIKQLVKAEIENHIGKGKW